VSECERVRKKNKSVTARGDVSFVQSLFVRVSKAIVSLRERERYDGKCVCE